jgi:hypothetical protein
MPATAVVCLTAARGPCCRRQNRRKCCRFIPASTCKCAKGERHGPIWYLTVTLGRGRTSGGIIPAERVNEVRAWIDNYHKLKDQLEKISEINRELLRRERDRKRRRKE